MSDNPFQAPKAALKSKDKQVIPLTIVIAYVLAISYGVIDLILYFMLNDTLSFLSVVSWVGFSVIPVVGICELIRHKKRLVWIPVALLLFLLILSYEKSFDIFLLLIFGAQLFVLLGILAIIFLPAGKTWFNSQENEPLI